MVTKINDWFQRNGHQNILFLRHTYLEMRFKEVHKDKFSVLKRAQEIQDKEGKRIDLIKTVISKFMADTPR